MGEYGETILVTGGTSGFGRLTVEALARQGYRVFAGMRAAEGKNAPAAEALRALAQRERLALQIVEIDVTDDASVERAIAVIFETTSRLVVVVNNAGCCTVVHWKHSPLNKSDSNSRPMSLASCA